MPSQRFATVMLLLIFTSTCGAQTPSHNLFQEAKHFSKNCFKPGGHSQYFLSALGKFTRLSTNDFKKSFNCEPKALKFELICEENTSNIYVQYAGGTNEDEFWYYGFKVDSDNKDTVTLSNFVRSKDPLKVCEELGIEVTLDKKEAEVPLMEILKKTEKTDFQPVKFSQILNSNKIPAKLSESEQKEADALMTTEIPEAPPAPELDKPWKIHSQIQPIVQKTHTFYTIGGYGSRPNIISTTEVDGSDIDRHNDLTELLMQNTAKAHMQMSNWLSDFHTAFAKQAEEAHRNHFQQLMDSLGSDQANNWKSIKKGPGGEKTIMTVLKETRNNFPSLMDRRLSQAKGTTISEPHELKFIPFDDTQVKDLDADSR